MMRRIALTAAFLASLTLGGCNVTGLGSDFGIGPTPGSGGWTGLPIGELLTRPTLQTQVLAACFSANCTEPAALLMLKAMGKDAADLRRTLRNPQSLASDIQSTRQGALAKRPQVETSISSQRDGNIQRITIRMLRADKPDVAVHGIIVAQDSGDVITAVISIASRLDVAEANAQSAAQELL
jgi:predicted small secreted protein